MEFLLESVLKKNILLHQIVALDASARGIARLK